MAYKPPESVLQDKYLKSIVSQFTSNPTDQSNIRQELESSIQQGAISGQLNNYANSYLTTGANNVLGQVQNLIAQHQQYQSYQNDPYSYLEGQLKQFGTDNTVLSDQQLQDKTDILNTIKGKTNNSVDVQSLKLAIGDKISDSNFSFKSGDDPAHAADPIIDRLANSIQLQLKNNNFNAQGFIDAVKSNFEPNAATGKNIWTPAIESRFNSIAQEVLAGGYRNNTQDYSLDLKNTSDLIQQRTLAASNKQAGLDYLTALPSELAASREPFLQSEQDRALANLRDFYNPQALASLNARGALNSGDVSDVLTQGVINTQSGLESERASLEAQDNSFYFNAAYQSKINDLLAKSTNAQDTLAAERQKVSDTQSQEFATAQAGLDASLQKSLTGRSYAQDLQVAENEKRRASNLAQNQQTIATQTAIGQAAGGIAGNVVAGPPGAAVASTAAGAAANPP